MMSVHVCVCVYVYVYVCVCMCVCVVCICFCVHAPVCSSAPYANRKFASHHLAGKEAGTNKAHRSVNRLASYHRGIYSRLGFMFAAPRSAGRLLVGR